MILPYMDLDSMSKDDQDERLNSIYTKMFVVAYSIIQDKQDALDIVQESWVKILENIDKLRDRQKFEQWSKAIAANMAINAIKQKMSRNTLKSTLQQIALAKKPIIEQRDTHLFEVEIRNSLEQLDQVTKKILFLKLYHGMKDQEIADVMNMSLAAVKSRIHKGRGRIRCALL